MCQGHFFWEFLFSFLLCIVRGGWAFWWLELGFGGKRCAASVVIHTYSGSAAFGFTERSRNFERDTKTKN